MIKKIKAFVIPMSFLMIAAVGCNNNPSSSSSKTTTSTTTTTTTTSTTTTTTTTVDPQTKHKIDVIEDDFIGISPNVNEAKKGENVSFTLTIDPNFEVNEVIVKDSLNNNIQTTYKDGSYSFTMPEYDVVISTKNGAAFNEEDIILRAPLLSDEHCERTSPIVSSDVTTSSIQAFNQLTGRNSYDVWLSCGDRSLTGTTSADESWYNAYNAGCSDSVDKLFFTHGNHDVNWSGCASRSEHYNWFNTKNANIYKNDATDSDPSTGNRHKVVNGIDFMTIDISSYDGSTNPINDSTKSWAKTVLDSIDPNKPVFVLSHCTAKNTIIGSRNDESYGVWGSSIDLYNIVKNYPNVILCSGHTHYDGHNDRNIWQGDFTSINVPTLAGGNDYDTYYNGIFDKLCDYDLEGNPTYKSSGQIDGYAESYSYKTSQGLYVEVDSSYNTRITRYDLVNKTQLGKPWIITSPKEDESHLFRYSEYGRSYFDNGPYFDGEATYSVSSNKVTVNFDSFKCDNDLINAYEIQIFNNMSESQLEDLSVPTERRVMYANWYKYDHPNYASEKYSYTFKGDYTSNFTVRVIALDSINRYSIIYPTAK